MKRTPDGLEPAAATGQGKTRIKARPRSTRVGRFFGHEAKVVVDCFYDGGRAVSWCKIVRFSRIPCVGESVSVLSNSDGSKVDGEPIDSRVEYLFWDVHGDLATPVVHISGNNAGSYRAGVGWMRKQGWSEWGGE